MRKLLWILTVAVLLGVVAVVVHSQRSGPTPEDKALAASLIQNALQDAAGIEDLSSRVNTVKRVLESAQEARDDLGQEAVRKPEALELLYDAFVDAAALTEEDGRLGQQLQVYNAASDLDPDAVAAWVQELDDADLAAAIAGEVGQMDPEAEVLDIATDDIQVAIDRCRDIVDEETRARAMIALAGRLLSANLSTVHARELLEDAGEIAEELPDANTRADLLQSAAQAVASISDEELLNWLVRARAAVDAIDADAIKARRLISLADIAAPGYPRYRSPQAVSGRDGIGTNEALEDFAAEAMTDAKAAALRLGADDEWQRDSTLRDVIRFELSLAKQAPEDGRRKALDTALETIRLLPLEGNDRAQLLADAVPVAKAIDRQLAVELLNESRDCLLPIDTDFETAMIHAAVIVQAAALGDDRCWQWAADGVRAARAAQWSFGANGPEIPAPLARAAVEAALLGATFATGDIQRAKKFMEKNSELGGYELGRAIWSTLTYAWDPSMSFDLTRDLLDDLKKKDMPVRGLIATLATVPAFAHHMFIPEVDAPDRAYPLFDDALTIASSSALPEDRALAAAALAAAVSPCDAERASRAVAEAGDALAAVADTKIRDGLAVPVCVMLAIADPDAAAELTSIVEDPSARCTVRLETAKAMLLDPATLKNESFDIF